MALAEERANKRVKEADEADDKFKEEHKEEIEAA